MPLQRRVPKFGFNNINRKEYQAVNLQTIQLLIDNKKVKDSINIQTFIDNGLASKNDLIKVLGDGEIKTAIKITAHKFSKSAQAQIEKTGGEAITL
jgi:large subunit ribosomal protein L15